MSPCKKGFYKGGSVKYPFQILTKNKWEGTENYWKKCFLVSKVKKVTCSRWDEYVK